MKLKRRVVYQLLVVGLGLTGIIISVYLFVQVMQQQTRSGFTIMLEAGSVLIQLVVAAIAGWGLQLAYRQQKKNKLLLEEKVKAELGLLKSGLSPQLLDDTLNYLYAMAYPVSDDLATAINKLKELMRYLLTESADGMADLQKEVDYLEKYLSIYRMRFADRFFADFKVTGNLLGQRVTSLLLIPFVEHALKQGVVNDPARPVRINLKITGNRLEFTISNKIGQQPNNSSGGAGLANIRRRLELTYPGRHELLVSANGQTSKTTLYVTL